MRLISLGSGSSGNGFILTTDSATILIDCGVGIRRIRSALNELNLTGRVDAVLLSHEHIDHIRALPSLFRYEHCPIYATRGTSQALDITADYRDLRFGESTSIGGMQITAVEVSHDAAEPCGFLIDTDDRSVAVFTDLGVSNSDVAWAVSQADVVVVESNYDDSMLQVSPYPVMLKRRIKGPQGHLSNDDCASLLVDSIGSKVESVWLAHLSEINNHPDVAEANVILAFGYSGLQVPVQALPRTEQADLLVPVANLR